MSSESRLWAWIKEKAPSTWHMVRVENALTAGTPDVNYCSHSGMEGWIELKHASAIRKDGRPIWGHELTVAQEDFLLRRHKNQSCSGILCQVLRERFFIPAVHATQFNNLTLEQLKQYDILAAWLKE